MKKGVSYGNITLIEKEYKKENLMNETAVVIVTALSFILSFFIAQEFQRIAEMKGHKENRYFWWTFLVAPAGMLMVIALPDNANKSETNNNVQDELPEI